MVKTSTVEQGGATGPAWCVLPLDLSGQPMNDLDDTVLRK
jgi:hypothetical protein